MYVVIHMASDTPFHYWMPESCLLINVRAKLALFFFKEPRVSSTGTQGPPTVGGKEKKRFRWVSLGNVPMFYIL